MALQQGDQNASSGMTKEIYDKIREVMEPINGVEGEDLENIRDSWKKLAYAISSGVIEHITNNMEINNIQTSGEINARISGATATINSHQHNVNLIATESNVTFTHTNGGIGLVG